MRRESLRAVLAVLLLGAAARVWAMESAPFDLAGPQLRVMITRAAHTLPVAEVPNLAVGDKLTIKAELPDSQAARYVMIVAFLRGATNPPPEEWFFRCDTWSRKCAAGLGLTVPAGAQQVLVFLAPSTGGDFQHLARRSARTSGRIRARLAGSQSGEPRPGSRLDSYLLAVRALNEADPSKLRAAGAAARS